MRPLGPNALLLGVDGGGTRCRARLSDPAGAKLGEATAGPANIRLGNGTGGDGSATAVAGAATLVLTARRFPLTPLAYRLIFVFSLVLMVGGRYTYAEVPAGFWIRTLAFVRSRRGPQWPFRRRMNISGRA